VGRERIKYSIANDDMGINFKNGGRRENMVDSLDIFPHLFAH
jgi:hypothetical protein